MCGSTVVKSAGSGSTTTSSAPMSAAILAAVFDSSRRSWPG
jgi:hypothetical protein